VSTDYTEIELDALRELANIGSSTAATALSSMLGRAVDVSVPSALALPLADAVDAAGPAGAEVTGIVLPVAGDLQAIVLLVAPSEDAITLCGLLGLEVDSEMGQSALREIGNILGSSYVNVLASMTGLDLTPHPPQSATDTLAAIVSTVLALEAESSDVAIQLDTKLTVEDADCAISFMFVPSAEGVRELLTRLGLAA
jgi:chemotaxis protein CheC